MLRLFKKVSFNSINPNGNPKPKKQKNSDIQLLRAVAIAAVLGFHLRPYLVPQGYLGVDIFFVISGYLMTSILDDKLLSLETCLKFYERRMRRLLPAYALVIFLTLGITGFFLIGTDYDFLKTDTLWALAFGTNFQSMFEKETYFKLVSDYKFLLHTWSLSVEFQYYFIAPFILIPLTYYDNPLIPTTCIIWASFAFQVLVPFPTISFGLVLSRIWQFLAGTVVFYLHKDRVVYTQLSELPDCPEEIVIEPEDSKVSDKLISAVPIFYENYYAQPKVLVFSALLILCFMPQLSDHFIYIASLRLIAIVLSGAVIYYGHQSTPSGKFAAFKKVGVYFGNVSYSLYLLHWPIIIFAKYQMWFNKIELWQILGIIILLTIMQYHCFEKVFLHQSSKVVFSMCGILYLGIIILLVRPQPLTFTDPAVLKNLKIAKDCGSLKDECNWDPELLQILPKSTKAGAFTCSYEGTGNATVYFSGNSHALRQLHGIKLALNTLYKKLYFVARPACLVFEDFNKGLNGYYQCDEVRNKTIEFLEKLRPDIVIISQQILPKKEFTQTKYLSVKVAKSDPTTARVAAYFQKWSPFTKKIFYLEPHPVLKFNPATVLAKEIAQNRDISNQFMNAQKISDQVDSPWFIIKAAMENCSKCEAIDMREEYMEDGKYYFYDKPSKLSLFCDHDHFSPIGVERMVPKLKRVITLDKL